jgi:isoleucyl-tRNA synthetase
MPFLAEDLYQRLSIEGKKESVHLESWPELGIAASSVLNDMEEARRIVTLALEARAKAGIKIRQPLASLTAPKLSAELAAIVADEVNVKEVKEGKEIALDTTITPELKEEGEVRDLVREIQDLRKKAGLSPGDPILLVLPKDAEALYAKHEKEVSATVAATGYRAGDALSIERP